MPDFYVNPMTGRDEMDRGNSSSDPLLTITFAIAEAVRRFDASFSTIYLAEGVYNRILGEDFPILLPQNISLVGAGTGRSIIDYERSATEQFDMCLRGGREISNLTIQGYPEEPGACDTSIAISLVADGSFLHDLTIQARSPIESEDKIFGDAIHSRDLFTTIENVIINRCINGISCSGETIIRYSQFNENGSGIAISAGICEVDHCRFDASNICGIGILTPSQASITHCQFLGCRSVGISIGREPNPDTFSSDKPFISHNDFAVESYFGILCDAEAIIDNNQFFVTPPYGSAIVMGRVERYSSTIAANPEIRNNTFMRITHTPTLFYPLVAVYEACNPLFEGNIFAVDGTYLTNLLRISHDANPDLGGGVTGSLGHNRFLSGWIEIQADERSIPREIFAQNNFWRFIPPRQGPDAFVPGDYYIDPHDAEVIVHTEEGKHI